MPLPNPTLLKHRILLLFRSKPLLSAAEMQTMLAKTGKTWSLQAIYKELRGLIREGILQKVGPRYTLHSGWLLQFQAFAARLTAVNFNDPDGIASLTRQTKKQSWTFSSLLEMNDLWGHLFIHLARHAQRKSILTWNPHLWFNLFQRETEDRLLRAILMTGCRFYVIVGGRQFLDIWAKELFDKNNVTYSQSPGPFHGDTATYFNVIDDHILTVKLAAATDRRLEEVYRTIKNQNQFLSSDLIGIFMRDGRCTLSLEFNPKKAAGLRQKFSKYFGTEF